MTAMERWAIQWDCGRGEVFATGGMLHHLALRLPDGRDVLPFAEAPWHGEADIQADAALAPHLRLLGGEWPCVPFGTSPADPAHHGYGSNADWRLVAREPSAVTIACRFPETHAVERLERRVRGVPGEAAAEMTLSVTARRDGPLPIGLHPILRLPETPETVAIGFGRMGYGEAFPEVFEPGASRLRPGGRFETLDAAPLAEGGTLDLSRLPLAGPASEDLVQVWETDGTFAAADRAAGTLTRLAWDPAAFPHCLLWLSMKGRRNRPWNGRFQGLGVEPIASAFDRGDLGQTFAAGRSGLARTFRAGETWTTRYRVSAEAL